MPVLLDTNEPDLILPDSRLIAPELLIPGRKPVGEVEIDREHPLAQSLEIILLGGQELKSATRSAMKASIFPQGTAWGGTSSAGNFSMTFPNLSIGTASPLTLLAGIYQPIAASTVGGIFELYVSISSYFKFAGTGSSQLAITRFGGGNTYTTLTTQAGEYNTIGIIRDPSTGSAFNAFCNGKFESGSLGSSIAVSSPTTYLMNDHNTASNTSPVFWLYIWRRNLNDSEVFSIYENPYQLIKRKAKEKAPPIQKLPQRANLSMPEPRTERPAMLIPGRKPVGRVAIDWSHSLAQELKTFYMPSMYYSGNSEVDIIGNTRAALQLSGSVDGVALEVHGGHVIAVPEGTYSVSGQFGVSFFVPGGMSDSKDVTVIAYSLIESSTFAGDLGIVSWDGTNPWSWLDWNGSEYRISAYTTYDTTNVITPAADTFFNYGLIWRTDNSYQTIREGEFSQSGTATRGSVTSNTVHFRRSTGTYTTYKNRTTGISNGLVYQAVWNRSLTEEEVRSFSRNPYQFLIPG